MSKRANLKENNTNKHKLIQENKLRIISFKTKQNQKIKRNFKRQSKDKNKKRRNILINVTLKIHSNPKKKMKSSCTRRQK